MMIEDPQLRLLLIRSCMGMPKLNYCWRVSEPSAIKEVALRADMVIAKALRDILSELPKSDIDDFTFNLATLPIALSRLGIERPTQVLKYAHLAALSDTVTLRKKQIPYLQPNEVLCEGMLAEFLSQLVPSIQSSQKAFKFRTSKCLGMQHSQRELAWLFVVSKRIDLLKEKRDLFRDPENKRMLYTQQQKLYTKRRKAPSRWRHSGC